MCRRWRRDTVQSVNWAPLHRFNRPWTLDQALFFRAEAAFGERPAGRDALQNRSGDAALEDAIRGMDRSDRDLLEDRCVVCPALNSSKMEHRPAKPATWRRWFSPVEGIEPQAGRRTVVCVCAKALPPVRPRTRRHASFNATPSRTRGLLAASYHRENPKLLYWWCGCPCSSLVGDCWPQTNNIYPSRPDDRSEGAWALGRAEAP